MCGICGIFSKNSIDNDTALSINDCLNTLRRRGPDSCGIHRDGSIVLGHTRLRIIDTRACADQPLCNENETVWVVFNGELYNYRSLRQKLLNNGHSFKSESDTEVLVHLYEEFGEKLVDHIEGMFAFAIWDKSNSKLLLVRDRHGIKPLYYSYKENEVNYFASELKAFLNLNRKWCLNLKAINHYLSLNFIPSPFTALENVYKLPPGSIAVFEKGLLKSVSTYWKPHDNYSLKEITNPVEECRSAIEEAVKSHMVSDVPIGAFLSGGIDSTIIVGLMSRYTRKVTTLTVGYDDPCLSSFDERKYARLVAKKYNTEHIEIILRAENTLEIIDDVLEYIDEPFGDFSLIPSYLVCNVAKQHFTVAMTGDGSDELFAGYRRYSLDRMVNNAPFLNKIAEFSKPIWSEIPQKRRTRLQRSLNTLKHFLNGLNTDMSARWLNWLRPFPDKELNDLLLNKDQYPSALSYSLISQLFEEYRYLPHLEKLLVIDQLLGLPGDMLTKVDLASSANSIETRVPFLDINVARAAAKLSENQKMGFWKLKTFLKTNFSDLIPEEILRRHKGGFTVPLGEWLRGPLSGLMHQYLSKELIGDYGLLNYESVNILKQNHMNKVYDCTWKLWNLIILNYWLSKYSSKLTITRV